MSQTCTQHCNLCATQSTPEADRDFLAMMPFIERKSTFRCTYSSV